MYKNIENYPEIAEDIELNIFDNNSPDNTEDIVSKFKEKMPFINYIKRPENIGADSNISAAYKDNNGEYVWVIGDDELLTEDSIYLVLNTIKQYNPSLIISLDAFKERIRLFKDYNDFVKKNYINIKYILWHTLISANIVKKDLIDFEFGQKMISELYGHMYGIFNNLTNSEYSYDNVVVINSCVLCRSDRAPFSDLNILKIIEQKQQKYIFWMCEKLKLNKFLVSNYIFIPRKYPIKTIFKSIFSVSNVYQGKLKTHKQLIILGIKLKFKINN